MEALEFLGGKYQKPELVVSGAVQTFRARDSVTNRFVFAHRVSMAEEPTEQAALLRLLTTGMIRSAEIRKLVLDFGEEGGFWYVVTQPEPECILLRPWLQSELDGLEAGAAARKAGSKTGEETVQKSGPVAAEETKQQAMSADRAGSTAASAPKPAIPKAEEPAKEVGEFTRMFRASSQEASKPAAPIVAQTEFPAKATEPPAKAPAKAEVEIPARTEPLKPEERKSEAGEFTRMFQASSQAPEKLPSAATPLRTEPIQPEIPEQAPVKGETGEFTRMFQAASGDTPKGPPPVASKPSQAEAGEFTRFFQGGLPPSQKAAPSSAERSSGGSSQDRPSKGGFVQRPNTPMPPPPAKQSEPGEFTRLFSSRPAPESAKPNASVPDLFGQSSDSRSGALEQAPRSRAEDFFEAERHDPTPEGPGEYTKIFGSGSAAAAPQQPSSTAEPVQAPLIDDYGRGTRPVPSIPVAPPPPTKGPSEYTLIVQGHRPSEVAGAPGSSAAGSDQAGSAKAFPNLGGSPLKGLHAPPLVPGAHVPQPKLPHAPTLPAAGNAAKLAADAGKAAGSPNKKLILLLVVLAVVAIVLVILVVLASKK
jgi:hypothetical protein